jgi:protein disulfide-isomerase-like protein
MLDKMMTQRVNTLKTIFKPSNLPRLFIIVVILMALYYVYTTYLKEGMTSSSDSCEITPDEFDKRVSSSNNQLVMFYAGWCGHCKKLEPMWDEVSKEVNSNKKDSMLKINVGGNEPGSSGPEYQKISEKYNIQGFPTIIIFKNGSPQSEYEGSRDKEGFLKALA